MLFPGRKNSKMKGVTLVELLVAVAMIGIFGLGMVAAYNMISKGVVVTKSKSIATNLAQEQIEKLKDYNYYRLLVTPTAALVDPSASSNPFPPETITVANIIYTRSTVVRKLLEDTSTGALTVLAPTDPDDGIKRIEVTLSWMENNQAKTTTLFNLFNNPSRTPQDGVINGNVKNPSSANVSNVRVYVTDNPNYGAYTDVSGNYSFRAPGGTYIVRADKKGYTSKTTGSFTLATGTTITSNFTNYTLKPVGTAAGYVFTRNHLLVSEVCTQYSAISPQQYVEIYNPTTSTITVNGNYTLYYYNTTASIKKSFSLVWVNNFIKPSGYFLFGSAALVNGTPADAYWTDGNVLNPDKGAAGIANMSGAWIDRASWSRSLHAAPDDGTETIAPDLSFWGGLVTGVVIERRPYPGVAAAGLLGNAYDSDNNSNDFHVHTSPSIQNYSSATEAPTGGTVVTGAYVFADDDVSSPTVSTGTGAYTLTNIAAGTWKFAGAGAGYYGEQTPVVISASAVTTSTLVLTGIATDGYITGRVTTGATTPLAGIAMYAGSNSSTDASGDYILAVTAGNQFVTANYLTANANYTTETSATPISIAPGAAVSNIDFNLSNGGAISGRITTNGTDPLPNIPVIAKDFANNERGSAITDSAGNYTISSLDTAGNPYSVFPALDEKEVGTPTSISATVIAGTTSPGYTFQVTTGLGSISGSAILASTGQPITTGVLVVVTTGTIATSTPPAIDSTIRAGATVYYSTTTDSNGNYSLPVRGSAAGTVYHLYSWYTSAAGTTSMCTGTNVVTSGASKTINVGF